MTSLQEACDFLASADARLAPLIAQHGLPERLLAKGPGSFATISKSICFQQLATRAAAVIFARVLTAANCETTGVLDPISVLNTPQEVFRAAGLSGRKAEYIHDLARHFHEGKLSDEIIDAMTPEELHTGNFIFISFLIYCPSMNLAILTKYSYILSFFVGKKALTAVKGLGPWSVDMFQVIFQLDYTLGNLALRSFSLSK